MLLPTTCQLSYYSRNATRRRYLFVIGHFFQGLKMIWNAKKIEWIFVEKNFLPTRNLPKQLERVILWPTKPGFAVIAVLRQWGKKNQHDRNTRRISRKPRNPFQIRGISARCTNAGAKDILKTFCIFKYICIYSKKTHLRPGPVEIWDGTTSPLREHAHFACIC